MRLCSVREYGLSDVRTALLRGHSASMVTPDDVSFLLVFYLEQECPWVTHRKEIESAIEKTDAYQISMAMIQRGLSDTSLVARVFRNIMVHPINDLRASHVMCNILHMLDITAFVGNLFESATDTQRGRVIDRLSSATTVSKRNRYRVCRNVVGELREWMGD